MMSKQATREMMKKAGPDREAIEALAHQYWMQRGCPDGSPEVDWLGAEEELQNRMGPMAQAA